MQQRPNRPRPNAPRRSAGTSARPAMSGARQPQRRRPMTPREYEMLQRRRRQQNIKYLAMLGAFALVLIVAAVLILKPKAPKDTSVQTVAAVTAVPEVSEVQTGGVDLGDPRDESAAAATATISTTAKAPSMARYLMFCCCRRRFSISYSRGVMGRRRWGCGLPEPLPARRMGALGRLGRCCMGHPP